jgi:hypothetical protein
MRMRASGPWRWCLACLCLVGLAAPADVAHKQPADQLAHFLPAWHFFQGATALEATGQLRDALRAIAAARRLEPGNREYNRVAARIWRSRQHEDAHAQQLMLTLKMGPMAEHATVGWMRGDDAYLVARSLAEQLSLAAGLEYPLYQLVINHEIALNISLPPVSQPPWDIPQDLLPAFSLLSHTETWREYRDDSPRLCRAAASAPHLPHPYLPSCRPGFPLEIRWKRSELEGQVRDARSGAHKFFGSMDSHVQVALGAAGRALESLSRSRSRSPSPSHSSSPSGQASAGADAAGGGGGLWGRRVAVIAVGPSVLAPSAAWYEGVCLATGAHTCTVLRPCASRIAADACRPRPLVSYDHPLLRSQCLPSPEEDKYRGHGWDLVMGFTALQHVGLGRYGDPVHPFADLAMMESMGAMAASGLVLIALPLAWHDAVAWNSHRLYGPLRLALLLFDWHVEGAWGAEEMSAAFGKVHSPAEDARAFRHNFSKVRYIVTLYSKYTMALTFQKIHPSL